MKISVLGCGRWGSCIAWYLDKIGHEVLSCGLADAPEFIQLQKYHCNDYLTFPESDRDFHFLTAPSLVFRGDRQKSA